jgi:hypothetical protein
VALVSWRREPLALENMAKVTTAIGAHNLRPRHAQGAVFMASDGAGDAIKISWPAAVGVELLLGLVQGCGTSRTGINALLRVVLVELAGARGLGTFLSQDTELLWIARALSLHATSSNGVQYCLPLLRIACHSSSVRLSG